MIIKQNQNRHILEMKESIHTDEFSKKGVPTVANKNGIHGTPRIYVDKRDELFSVIKRANY